MFGTLPRKVITTKTRTVIHEVIEKVDGKKFEKWQLGNKIFFIPSGETAWRECIVSPDFDPVSEIELRGVPSGGFRDLEWIQSGTFAGEVTKGKNRLLFFTPKPSGVTDPAKLEKLQDVAIIDEATRLPILIRSEGITRGFTFLEAPTAMQSLPADLVKEIKDRSEKVRRVLGGE